MLHSAFWAHGAAELAIPCSWSTGASIYHDDDRTLWRPQPKPSTGSSSAPTYEGLFLDFLYPAQAVNVIQRLSAEDSARGHQRSSKTFHRKGRRAYTSRATKLPSDPHNKNAELESNARDNTTLNDEARGFEPTEELEQAELPEQAEGLEQAEEPEQDERLEQAERPEQAERDPREELFILLQAPVRPDRRDFDKAWRLYHESQMQDPSFVLEYLSASSRDDDARRMLSLFDGMVFEEKTSSDYRHAYTATVRLGDDTREAEIYQAYQQHYPGSLEPDTIFAHAIVRGDWLMAFEVWRAFEEKADDHGQTPTPQPQQLENEGMSDSVLSDQSGALDPSNAGPFASRLDLWGSAIIYPLFIDKAIDLVNLSDAEYTGMLAASVRPGPASAAFLLEIIRWALCTNSKLPTLRFFVEKLKKMEADTTTSFENIISYHLRFSQFRSGLYLYLHFRQLPNFFLSQSSLRNMLKAFRTLRNLRGLQYILADWSMCHGTPDKDIFKISMAEFAEDGDVETVQELFNRFYEAYGSELVVKDLHPLLHAHSRRGYVRHTVNLFHGISEEFGLDPGVGAWRIVIEAHVRTNNSDGALQWFDNMRKADMIPDRYILSELMQMLANRGDVESVEDLLDFALSNSVVRAASFLDCLVQAHINNEDMDRAEEVAEEAMSMHFRGSFTPMWNHILAAYAFRGDLLETQRIYQRMVDLGLRFDGMTFAGLMQSLVSIGQVDAAEKVLEEIIPQHNVKAVALHYAIVMSAFARQGAHSKIHQLFNRMLRRQISPSLKANSELVRQWPQMSRISEEGKETVEEQILDYLLRRTNTQEAISRQSLRGYGMQEISRAFPSAYLDFLLRMVGPGKAYDKTAQLYTRSLRLLQRPETKGITSLALKMATALMISEYRRGNYDNTQVVWDLIRAENEKQARKWDNAMTDEADWVSPDQRYVLTVPFLYLVRSMIARQDLSVSDKVVDLRVLVRGILRDGFQLDNRSWNLYIQYLAQISIQREHRLHRQPRFEAFVLCESNLMAGWRGWDARSRQPFRGLKHPLDTLTFPESHEVSRGIDNGEGSTTSQPNDQGDESSPFQTRRPGFLRPIRQTIVNLSHAVTELENEEEALRQRGIIDEEEDPIFEKLSIECPRTIHMLRRMPKDYTLDDTRTMV